LADGRGLTMKPYSGRIPRPRRSADVDALTSMLWWPRHELEAHKRRAAALVELGHSKERATWLAFQEIEAARTTEARGG
jgi:hypothetical protein